MAHYLRHVATHLHVIDFLRGRDAFCYWPLRVHAITELRGYNLLLLDSLIIAVILLRFAIVEI